MKNVLLTISYDGTNFSGWQRQPDKRTVQGELERVLSVLCRQPIQIAGTSRTDAGVHAFGQRASFEAEFGIPVERISLAANHLLAGEAGMQKGTGDVRIVEAREMPKGFHARFDACGKKYIYRIRNGGKPDLFQRNCVYQVEPPLNVPAMQEAAALFQGTHDFKCFMAAGGNVPDSTVRTIYSLLVRENEQAEKDGAQSIEIEVTGDGFLYNMVRIITGTLVEVGMGKKSIKDAAAILAGKNRCLAGHTAPPQGLYLVEVYYEKQDWM